VRIDLNDSVNLERISIKESIGVNVKLETPTGMDVLITPHVAFLYNSLVTRLPLGSAVRLDSLLGPLQKILPELYKRMGQDLVIRYHEQGDLQSSNRLPRKIFWVALLLFFALFIFTGMLWNRLFVTPLPASGPMVILLVIALFVMLAWWIASTQISKSLSKSAKKEAKRWLGFKAYLQDIQKYGELAEAQEILDRYFDYAVALDVDERLVQQVRAMGGVVPVWLGHSKLDDGTLWEGGLTAGRPEYVRPWYRRGSWTGRPPRPAAAGRAAKLGMSNDGRPSLQRLSDDLNGSLSTASRSLTGILNSAVGEGGEPVKVKINAFGSAADLEWNPETPVDQVIGDIMRKSQTLRPPRSSRSSGGGFRGGSGGSSFRSSSRSSSRRSSRSSSRRSGGGGKRGFR